MIIESHVQLSPEPETCDVCVLWEEINVEIPPFTQYYFVMFESGSTKNVCEGHFATLQSDHDHDDSDVPV